MHVKLRISMLSGPSVLRIMAAGAPDSANMHDKDSIYYSNVTQSQCLPGIH